MVIVYVHVENRVSWRWLEGSRVEVIHISIGLILWMVALFTRSSVLVGDFSCRAFLPSLQNPLLLRLFSLFHALLRPLAPFFSSFLSLYFRSPFPSTLLPLFYPPSFPFCSLIPARPTPRRHISRHSWARWCVFIVFRLFAFSMNGISINWNILTKTLHINGNVNWGAERLLWAPFCMATGAGGAQHAPKDSLEQRSCTTLVSRVFCLFCCFCASFCRWMLRAFRRRKPVQFMEPQYPAHNGKDS